MNVKKSLKRYNHGKRFRNCIALLLCIAMMLSIFVSVIPMKVAAETFEKNEEFAKNHPNALHFYIRHWHSEEVTGGTKFQVGSVESVGRYFVVVEGYINPNNKGTYDFYFVYQTDMNDNVHFKGDVVKTDTELATDSDYIVAMDTKKGSITLQAHPINPEDRDIDVVEKFSAFSMSGGQSAVKYGTGDHSDELTITYTPYTHLIKGHVYYVNESKRVDGTVFGESGLSDDLEKDTALVYIYTGADDFTYKHDDGVTVTYKTGDIVKTKARSNVACTDAAGLPSGLKKGENVKLVKFYSTDVGLHTDKTATSCGDGRTFNLELESWYVENYSPDVGMVLDASGSMAFASDTPERIKLTDAQIESLGIKQVTSAKNPKNSAGGWNDYFLTDAQIKNFLNPHNTDNSLLSVSGYNYFVYDSNEGTREYAPIGYWSGSNLIGFYSFDDSSNRLLNSVTGKSATVVKQQATNGSNIDFTESASASGIEYDNNQLSISKNSTAGILLDAKPTGGDFTISFSVVRGSKNAESDPQYPADILYVGDKTPTNKNYLRVIREGINVNGYVKNSGPISSAGARSVRRAWITGYQGNPRNAQYFFNDDINDNLVSATSAFHTSDTRIVTYVFKDGKLTTYFDGTKEINIANDAEIPQTYDLTLDDFNIVFNGFSTSQYNGKNIAVDNISVFDKALTASEIKAYVTSLNNSTPTLSDGVMLDGGAALKLGNTTDKTGWFYVSHTGSETNIVNKFNSAKVMFGVQKDFGFVDTIDAPEGDGAGTGYSYEPTENTPIRFYVDGDGYLRCFFSRGSSPSNGKSPSITSYVYELTDPQYVKTEALRRAVGSFITQLSERSPLSLFSAVRFSSDTILAEKEKALLLDWTSDYTDAGFLSLTHGDIAEGELRGYNSYDAKGQYNYGLTGNTCTYKGLEAYIDLLDKKLPDLTNQNSPKFLIIFTDGADTDFRRTANGEKAKEYADQLKEKGYTIFTVLLNGGPVEKGGSDYIKAHEFLVSLSGNNEDGTDPENFFFSVDDAKEKFEQQGIDTSGMNDSDILTKIFTDEILGIIALDREDYSVKDYIDPRFDLVDAKGVVWHLDAGGKITKSNGDKPTVNGESKIKIELSHKSSEDARNPYLRYDAEQKMYYLEWENQNIPGCAIGADRLTVWKATVTVRAKSDFIGGNAALTNGNDALQNYVYHADDTIYTPSSGTGNSKLPQGMKPAEAKEFPLSKGFPRTAVNVMPNDIEKERGREIYMGEELSSQLEIVNNLVEDTKGTNEYYYWEYLERYVNYYNELVAVNNKIKEENKNRPPEEQKELLELPPLPKRIGIFIEEINPGDGNELYISDLFDAILNAELELPYCYLPATEADNETGGREHKIDVFGYLTYSTGEADGQMQYPGEKDDKTSSDTVSRSISLSVIYNPTSVDDRVVYDEKLVIEENSEGEDIYVWDKDYKGAVGTELTSSNVPNLSGNHTTTIVSGDIVLQMTVNAEKIKKLKGKITGPISVAYVANLYRSYTKETEKYTADSPVAIAELEESAEEEKIGTYTIEKQYSNLDELLRGEPLTAVITIDENFKEYGLPIGTYTLEKVSSSINTQWLKFGSIDAFSITDEDLKAFQENGINTSQEDNAGAYQAPTENNTAYLGTKAQEGDDYCEDLYALFKVSLDPIDMGDLQVEKKVVDNGNKKGDKNKQFDFTIELTLPDEFKDIDLNQSNPTLTNLGNGKWRVNTKLAHGEIITVKDIPEGTTFIVTEGAAEGYNLKDVETSLATAAEGTASGKIVKDKTASVTFINEPISEEGVPNVGGIGTYPFYTVGALLVMTALTTLFYRKKKMVKE